MLRPACARAGLGRRCWPTSPCASRSSPMWRRAWRRPSASSSYAASWKQSARSWASWTASRRSPRPRVTAASGVAHPARRRPRRRAARGRQAGAHQRAEPRTRLVSTWIETVLELPGARPRRTTSTSPTPGRCSTRTTTGCRDVKERILEHLAVRKLRHERGLAPVGRGPGPSWPWSARRGWARRRWASRWRAALGRRFVRVSLGRRARRGRDQGAPAHLRRSPTRTPGPGPARGGDHEPGRRAGRGRQARFRLPGRPVFGSPRGARPGPEPHLP